MDSVFFETVEYKFILHVYPLKIFLMAPSLPAVANFKCSKFLLLQFYLVFRSTINKMHYWITKYRYSTEKGPISWWQDNIMALSKGRFWKSLLLSTDFFGTAVNHISEIVLVNYELKRDIIKRFFFHLLVGRVLLWQRWISVLNYRKGRQRGKSSEKNLLFWQFWHDVNIVNVVSYGLF